MSEPHYNHGHFVWRELITSNIEAAKGFYGELLGWKFQTMDMPNGTQYTVAQAGEKMVAGIMAPPMPNMPTHWMPYASVADVDAAAKAAEAAGGSVAAPPMDISVGRFAVVADPGGAHFTVWKANDGDGGPVEVPGPGTFCWETVTVPDAGAITDFYKSVLGWRTDVGPAGPDSVVFKMGEFPVADVQVSDQAPPHWLTYVVAGEANAARERAKALGAQIIVPLIEVPNVGNIVLIQDPVGAFIGLFEPKFPG